MGRHSAPADDTDDVADDVAGAPGTVAVSDRPTPRGRHSADAADEPRAEVAVEASAVAVLPDERRPKPVAVPPVAPETAPPAGASPAGEAVEPAPEAAPLSDFALVRQRSDVRARVVAAVLVPFVLYTVVMLLIGQMDRYLWWLFIPLITAGVLAGAILDRAHKATRPPQ